jgi:hypothetical protein
MRTLRKLTSHERDKIAYWYGGRLDAVGRQRAISGIGLAINSVRRRIGSSVFGLTLESRRCTVSKTSVIETRRSPS